jgi:hypothetical protein
MRKLVRLLALGVCAAVLLSQAAAQPPGDKEKKDKGAAEPGKEKKDYANSPLVKRMMAFDKNGDGKLTRDEITDPRLMRLFEMADANGDGVVTLAELIALAEKLDAEGGQGGRGPGGPPDGPGGRGPGGRGPGGPGGPSDGAGGRGPGGRGPGGPGGPPQPGVILPPPVQERLNLSADQKKQLEVLQKEVDDRLAKILTEDQKKQLKEMQDFGPRGPGGRGPGGPEGPGGPGRPGGPGGRDPGR